MEIQIEADCNFIIDGYDLPSSVDVPTCWPCVTYQVTFCAIGGRIPNSTATWRSLTGIDLLNVLTMTNALLLAVHVGCWDTTWKSK